MDSASRDEVRHSGASHGPSVQASGKGEVTEDPRESNPDGGGPSIGFIFAVVVVFVVFIVGWMYATDEIDDDALANLVGVVIIGGIVGATLMAAGLLFQRIASKGKEVAKRVIENQPVQKMKGASKAAAKAISGVATSEVSKQQVNATKYDNLLKLKTLLDQNVISQEEFEGEKRKILGDQE